MQICFNTFSEQKNFYHCSYCFLFLIFLMNFLNSLYLFPFSLSNFNPSVVPQCTLSGSFLLNCFGLCVFTHTQPCDTDTAAAASGMCRSHGSRNVRLCLLQHCSETEFECATVLCGLI